MNKNILITGANGMLGTHLKKYFPNAQCPSRKELDLTNEQHVEYMISAYNPDVIIHAAARVGGIMENITYPYDFFEQNVLMNTLIVKHSIKYKISRFIGILSTCIYPDVMPSYPMYEEHLFLGPPALTNFSYGYSKRNLAVQIDAANKQFGLKYNYVIPSNLYSEYDRTDDDKKMHFITALLKKIKDAEQNGKKEITVFGDGSPLRQFMYADDLARVLKIMVDDDITESFNVAPENQNYSIKEMIQMTLEVLNKSDWTVNYDTSKPNGQFRKDVSIQKFKNNIKDFEFTQFKDGILKVYRNL